MVAASLGEVYILRTLDRAFGIPELLRNFDLNAFSDAKVAIKANFNSADPFPASTHLDTLRAIVENLQSADVTSITLAERSGMGDTKEVLQQMGVFDLAKELAFNVVVLDELKKDGWKKFEHDGTHWLNGFYIANVFLEADKVVQTCCLKTHRFGGHFTLSMKNSVGLIAKRVPGELYNYMAELHSSLNQRKMIAEINNRYNVDLIVMDGLKAFVTGGPEQGKVVEPNLLLASKDRVAIDAVGAAVLKMYGAKGKLGREEVFDQDQIARAAELGFGVKSADEIRMIPLDDETKEDVDQIEQVLKAQVAVH